MQPKLFDKKWNLGDGLVKTNFGAPDKKFRERNQEETKVFVRVTLYARGQKVIKIYILLHFSYNL